MREEQTRQTIRLRLLALVLAFALTWYAMNPAAAGPARRVKRDEEPPDEKRREVKSPLEVSHVLRTEGDMMKSSLNQFSQAAESIDDLEWPEIIDLR